MAFSEEKKADLRTSISDIFERHHVAGLSLAVIDGNDVRPFGFGMANRESGTPVNEDTLFQIASCSKTIATYLMLKSGAFPLETSVNDLLRKYGSTYRIQSPEDKDFNANEVTVGHLLNHTALSMHYVNGISEQDKMPDMMDLISGNEKYDYLPVELLKHPGSKFKYSGGGFILAQHLMDLKFGVNWRYTPLEADIRFDFDQVKDDAYAMGYRDDGEAVRFQFPSFAAGMIASPRELAKFLIALRGEFKKGNLLEMIDSEEKGSKDFIGGMSGHGIFIFQAGHNKFIGHHGANDGFRGIYLLCIEGPNDGQGLVLFSNGEEESIFLNAEVCKHVLQTHFGILNGMNFADASGFVTDPSTPKEQVINFGMKSLVFDGFQEPIGFDWSKAKHPQFPTKRAVSK